MSTSTDCLLSDPDISGIGVRIAIYIQNLLSFIPAILAIRDGKVSLNELESAETQSTTILLTAFAILISAMVQVARHGLSSFQASIVLNLSWMNNTNTFIYFLLYIHHKSQRGEEGVEPIMPTWSAWIQHTRDRLSLRSVTAEVRGLLQLFRTKEEQLSVDLEKQSPSNQDTKSPPQSLIKNFFERIVLLLGSLHLTLMAVLGIWMWSNPGSFGALGSCPTSINSLSMVILGPRVSLGSGGLHGWSLAIYSLFLVPGLNLVIPAAFFLLVYIGYQYLHGKYQAWHVSEEGMKGKEKGMKEKEKENEDQSSIVPIIIGMVFLIAINLVFIVDTELTLQQNIDTDGSNWTFGQVLAMVLIAVPLRDVVESSMQWREKRIEERMEKQNRLKREIGGQAKEMDAALSWVRRGANVNVKVEGYECVTALQVVSFHGNEDIVKILLDKGADPNIQGENVGNMGQPFGQLYIKKHKEIVKLLLEKGASPNVQGGEYGTALQAASYWGYKEIVKLLLDKGADPNVQSGEYGTALQAASCWGNKEIVELLFDKGADPNIQGGQHWTALQAASYDGDKEVVKLLLEKGAEPNIQGGDYGTALQAASYKRHREIVKLLFDKGADPNIQGGKHWTALQAASYDGDKQVVKLLLENGADPNIQGGQYGTALQTASCWGHKEIVELLFDKGADPNIQGGQYGTALQVASQKGHKEIVKLLLDKGADPNIQGGEYGTALQAASQKGHEEIVKLLLEKGASQM
ncbi:hypothetical protein D9758_012147 [Tetrapyrgos nigripes]|uniref:Uncharacterized protein n=1 Tax=Tetrapyrgos nigripes TaxID=182062 RepID=A0A8H5CLH2_9AGAR|nr:hypothetical protein D9758_012147 [Tetrapyrgos nigripes]